MKKIFLGIFLLLSSFFYTGFYEVNASNDLLYINNNDSGKIYLKNSDDTSDGTAINSANSFAPSFSYDRKNIIYSNIDDGYKIYKKNANDTSNGTAINSVGAIDSIYSPDGQYIYYNNLSDGYKIYKKNANDTSNGTAINSAASLIGDISLDGQYLIYSNIDDGYKIYKKSVNDTSNGTAINSTWSYSARYSPDGQYIIYVDEINSRRIYKKNANDTSNGTPINSGPTICNNSSYFIDYSPDGQYIVYCNFNDGSKLYKKNANDTSNGTAINSVNSSYPRYFYKSSKNSLYCETINSTVPQFTAESLYYLQGAGANYDSYYRGEHSFSFPRKTGGGGFYGYYFEGYDDDEPRYFNSSDIEVFGSGALPIFTDDGYYTIPNEGKTVARSTDPSLVVYNSLGFYELQVVSNDDEFDYKVFNYNTSSSSWDLLTMRDGSGSVIPFCTSDEICSLVNQSFPIEFYTIKIVPTVTNNNFQLFDFEIKGFALYDYTVSYSGGEICTYDDGSLTYNDEVITKEEFEEITKETSQLPNSQSVTQICSNYSTLEKIQNPICWSDAINKFLSNNSLLSPFYNFIKSFMYFLDLKVATPVYSITVYLPNNKLELTPRVIDFSKKYVFTDYLGTDIQSDDDLYKFIEIFIILVFTLIFILSSLLFPLVLLGLPATFFYTIYLFLEIITVKFLGENHTQGKLSLINIFSYLSLFAVFVSIYDFIMKPYLDFIKTLHTYFKNHVSAFLDYSYAMFFNQDLGVFIQFSNGFVVWFYGLVIGVAVSTIFIKFGRT